MEDDIPKFSYLNCQKFIPDHILESMPSPLSEEIIVYMISEGKVSLFGEGEGIKVEPRHLVLEAGNPFNKQYNTWSILKGIGKAGFDASRKALRGRVKSMDEYKKYVKVRGIPTSLWSSNDEEDIVLAYIVTPREMYDENFIKNPLSAYLLVENTTNDKNDYNNKFISSTSFHVMNLVRTMDSVDDSRNDRVDMLFNTGNLRSIRNLPDNTPVDKILDGSEESAKTLGAINAVNIMANMESGTIFNIDKEDYKISPYDIIHMQKIMDEIKDKDWFKDMSNKALSEYNIIIGKVGGHKQSSAKAIEFYNRAVNDVEKRSQTSADRLENDYERKDLEEYKSRIEKDGKADEEPTDDKSHFNKVLVTDGKSFKESIHAFLEELDGNSSWLRSWFGRNKIEKAYSGTEGGKLIIKAYRFKPYRSDEDEGLQKYDILSFRKMLGGLIARNAVVSYASKLYKKETLFGSSRSKSQSGHSYGKKTGLRIDKSGNVIDVEINRSDVKVDPNVPGNFIIPYNDKLFSVPQVSTIRLKNGNIGVMKRYVGYTGKDETDTPDKNTKKEYGALGGEISNELSDMGDTREDKSRVASKGLRTSRRAGSLASHILNTNKDKN